MFEPLTWTVGFTFDPDTVTPTSSSAGNGNTNVFYGKDAGLSGYLKYGSQTANVDYVESQFTTSQPLGNHSFVIRYVIDEAPYYDPETCFARPQSACPDDDQNDGLSLPSNRGGISPLDVNQIQFSFYLRDRNNPFFDWPGDLAQLSFDALSEDRVGVSSGMDVYGIGIAGSRYTTLSGSAISAGAFAPVGDGGGLDAAVPLPASAWLMLASLGGLAAARRRLG